MVSLQKIFPSSFNPGLARGSRGVISSDFYQNPAAAGADLSSSVCLPRFCSEEMTSGWPRQTQRVHVSLPLLSATNRHRCMSTRILTTKKKWPQSALAAAFLLPCFFPVCMQQGCRMLVGRDESEGLEVGWGGRGRSRDSPVQHRLLLFYPTLLWLKCWCMFTGWGHPMFSLHVAATLSSANKNTLYCNMKKIKIKAHTHTAFAHERNSVKWSLLTITP